MIAREERFEQFWLWSFNKVPPGNSSPSQPQLVSVACFPLSLFAGICNSVKDVNSFKLEPGCFRIVPGKRLAFHVMWTAFSLYRGTTALRL